MVCDYRYYEEDDPKGASDCNYYIRMKVYDCNPCKSRPDRRYYCQDRRSAGSPAAPVLSGTPALPAVPVSPGLQGLPGPSPLGPGPLGSALPVQSTPSTVPILINDYWADDYYRRIGNR